MLVNLDVYGLKEKASISNDELLKGINKLDSEQRLYIYSNIDLYFDTDKQLELLANSMNQINKDELTPAQKRVLISFLEANINKLR